VRRSAWVAVRGLVVTLVAAGWVGLAGTAHAQAVSAGTVTLSGDSFVGGSQTFATSAGDPLSTGTDAMGNHITVLFGNTGQPQKTIDLAAPKGERLAIGTYANAVSAPYAGGTLPTLEIAGALGCSRTAGSFTISNIVFGPTGYFGPNLSYLQALDATLEQHCEGATAQVLGTIHIANLPAPPVTVTVSTSPPGPVISGTEVTLAARIEPAGITGTVSFYDGTRFAQGGGYNQPGLATGSVIPNPGSHSYTAVFSPTNPAYPAITSPPLAMMALSPHPSMTLSADPPSPAAPPDAGTSMSVRLTVTATPGIAGRINIYDGTTDLGTATSVNAHTSVRTVVLPTGLHALVAVFTPDDISVVPMTSQLLSYSVVPCPCAAIPLSAADNTPPYAGNLSLGVNPGTMIRLIQVDPSTPAGHPVQATDPTKHRHAWVFTGNLADVSIKDTRPDQPGWTLSGRAVDFINGATTVPAANFGWTPATVPIGSDAEGAVGAGPAVYPRLQDAAGGGLATTQILAAAPSGNGLGTQIVGAEARLWIPDTSPTGTYASTLTLTLISP
jgi:hypothetical protein